MPDPIPVMVLGRLAVDKAYRKRGVVYERSGFSESPVDPMTLMVGRGSTPDSAHARVPPAPAPLRVFLKKTHRRPARTALGA